MKTLSATQTAFFKDVHAGLRRPGFWHADHPFLRDLEAGRLAIEPLKRWIIEMYIRVDHSLPFFGVVYANCPDPQARKLIFDNLMEEERGIFSGTDGHLVLLRRYADALGITQAEWDRVAESVSLETKALMWFEQAQAYARPWYVWLSAVGIGEEAQVPHYFGTVAEASRRHYGISKDDDLTFWTVHISVDAEHGDVTERLVSQALSSPAEEQEVRQAVYQLADLVYAQMTAAVREGL
jgi:pyrroloquinoline-quinone synthase